MYKKILILFVIIILTVIVWHLIQQRWEIAAELKAAEKRVEKSRETIEKFTVFNTPDAELSSVKNSSTVKIQNVSALYLDQPLRQFCIKSSYNTAVTGSFVNTDMIKYVLSRGVRYLDFEIFMINNVPTVAYSTDPNFEIIDTDNTILLNAALSTIISNAFSTHTSPNNGDPLFINMRIKSNDTGVYKAVANTINSVLMSNLLYEGKVTGDTKLRNLMGKIIIVMDRTIAPMYAKYCKCSGSDNNNNCHDLTEYINVESGTSALYQNQYTEIINQSSIQINTMLDICSICTDIKHMRIVLPDLNYKNTKNPIVENLITQYGVQIVPYRFNSNDGGLADYEALFDYQTLKSAFAPLATAIKYIQEKNSGNGQ